MESKQTPQTGQKPDNTAQSKAVKELSDRLTDIDLKLDHIIERIKDSIRNSNSRDKDDWEERP